MRGRVLRLGFAGRRHAQGGIASWLRNALTQSVSQRRGSSKQFLSRFSGFQPGRCQGFWAMMSWPWFCSFCCLVCLRTCLCERGGSLVRTTSYNLSYVYFPIDKSFLQSIICLLSYRSLMCLLSSIYFEPIYHICLLSYLFYNLSYKLYFRIYFEQTNQEDFWLVTHVIKTKCLLTLMVVSLS